MSIEVTINSVDYMVVYDENEHNYYAQRMTDWQVSDGAYETPDKCIEAVRRGYAFLD